MMEREPHIFDQDRYIAEENRMIQESRIKRIQYLEGHANIAQRQKDLIGGGVLGLGLTGEQVILIIGKEPINKSSTNKYGADEEWLYKEGIRRRYLYFKDDILVKIEDCDETIWGLKRVNQK